MNEINLLNFTKERFSFREMEHIAVNYTITCMKGYEGTFKDYYKGVRSDWRKWLKDLDKKMYETNKILNYKYSHGIIGTDIITVYNDNNVLCELDVFADSPYNPPEEIQNWLDSNGYEDEEFEFNEIE